MISYPNDMLATIARIFFLSPDDFIHLGYDGLSLQKEWENLSESEKMIWYDKASNWLDEIKIKMPDAYNAYINNWKPDQQNWQFDFI